MKYKLEMDCINSAFEDAPLREIARILREQADHMERFSDQNGWLASLRDSNGNVVGRAEVIE